MDETNKIKVEFVSREIENQIMLPAVPSKKERIRVEKKIKFNLKPQLALKIAVCAAICLICLLIKLIDTPLTNKISSFIEGAITYDLDLDESLGQLKFVQNIFPGISTVFNANKGMRYPVEGNVICNFGQEGSKGIRLLAQPGADVIAAQDGMVVKRGINSELGNYLRIKHNGGIETFYYGLEYSDLPEGASVARGDIIATLKDSGVLYFEVQVNGKHKDPLTYLGTN